MREQISEFAEYNSASIRSAYDNPDSRITIKVCQARHICCQYSIQLAMKAVFS